MEDNILMKSFSFDGIHNDRQRTFKCWGSVEVLDRHGEIIPAEEVFKVMDIWMDRGAPIMFNHTNRQIGKGTNWQPLNKNGKPGVLITAKVYDHYKEDDDVWKKLKSSFEKMQNGISLDKDDFEGLSIGGKSFKRESTEAGTILRDLIGYEFSVVNRTGNQEATMVEFNSLAKSEKMVKEEIKKEEPQVTKPEEEKETNAVDELAGMVEALVERLANMEAKFEELTSGKPEEPEQAVEEKKAEDQEEETPEEEEKKEKPKDDEMAKVKKELAEIKKSLVKEVIKSDLPEEKTTTNDDLTELRKSYQGSNKIDFVEMGKKMRELKL